MYISSAILNVSKNEGECTILVKNGFKGIAHFMNHPEMLPYVDGEVLFVGECVNLPDGVFANKAEIFQS